MNIQQLTTLFKSQADCEEYISAKGNRCFRTYGSENWYYLLCRKCGITPKYAESKREELQDYYLEGVMACDGAEKERYMNIYCDLKMGNQFCSDGDDRLRI